MEKHKIFISGLPFSCTKEQLEEICKQHGTVKEVRLVTYRSGKPKVRHGEAVIIIGHRSPFNRCINSCVVALQGLAYVEFADETQASQAVLKMDGVEVEGNKISVAISNPPRRNPNEKPGSSRPATDMMPRQNYGS